jgi:hypothetical protein
MDLALDIFNFLSLYPWLWVVKSIAFRIKQQKQHREIIKEYNVKFR